MNTIKINEKKGTLFVAHRGLSGIETQNTAAAFIAAANRSYFGIECDVHKTADGAYVVIHDEETKAVCKNNIPVETSPLSDLRALRLNSAYGKCERNDLCIPTLAEYITICHHYEKTAVLELKNGFSFDEVKEIMQIIEQNGRLDNVIIISFVFENLLHVRAINPHQRVQYLMGEFTPDLIGLLVKHRMDLDIFRKAIDKEKIDACHENGILVNVWTVDDPKNAQDLIDMGVDFITTNILE